jgi:hypothetical protein
MADPKQMSEADALYGLLQQGQPQQQSAPVNADTLYNALRTTPQADQMPWMDVPIKAAANIVPSAMKMGQGMVEAVSNPLQTGKSLWDLAAGTLRNVTPSHISEWIDKADKSTEAASHASSVADIVGHYFKDRYGSTEGFKKAIAYDPVGVLSDVSTVFTGGSALPGTVGKTAAKVAEATNPISMVGNVVAPVVKTGLAVSTGTSPETIAGAVKAGATGDKTLLQNLRGEAQMTDALDNAKHNLGLMRQAKNQAYRSGMVDISNDASQLHFNDVDKALNELEKSATYKGQIVNPTANKLHKDLTKIVDNWKNLDPVQFHTPEGFDALKQTIGEAIDNVPYEQSKARTMGSKVYNGVKDTINKQAQTYSKVMKDYAEASDQISQIEKSLSLGNKASVDTAMRKLQSLTRNNVNTNYGQRMSLAQQLESQQGAKPFISALYGQALSSPTARGMAGTLEGATGLYGALVNPAALAAIPLQTPRLVGEGLYQAGRIGQPIVNAANRIGLNPMTANTLGDLANISNRGQQ